MIESKICVFHTILFMCERSIERDSQRLVLSNPRLARPGTTQSLRIFIDLWWHTSTVIYYHHYFGWINIMFDHFREDFVNSSSPLEMAAYTFHFNDFLRKHSKHLIDSAGMNDHITRDSQLILIFNVPERFRFRAVPDQHG